MTDCERGTLPRTRQASGAPFTVALALLAPAMALCLVGVGDVRAQEGPGPDMSRIGFPISRRAAVAASPSMAAPA